MQLKKALEDLAELQAEKDALAQRCQELDIQVMKLHSLLWVTSSGLPVDRPEVQPHAAGASVEMLV